MRYINPRLCATFPLRRYALNIYSRTVPDYKFHQGTRIESLMRYTIFSLPWNLSERRYSRCQIWKMIYKKKKKEKEIIKTVLSLGGSRRRRIFIEAWYEKSWRVWATLESWTLFFNVFRAMLFLSALRCKARDGFNNNTSWRFPHEMGNFIFSP